MSIRSNIKFRTNDEGLNQRNIYVTRSSVHIKRKRVYNSTDIIHFITFFKPRLVFCVLSRRSTLNLAILSTFCSGSFFTYSSIYLRKFPFHLIHISTRGLKHLTLSL